MMFKFPILKINGRGGQIAKQSTMLFSGFAAAQICSFARNALIGHWLSKGDFGIAASITLLLQLLETLSDLGSDKLIVQSEHGEDKELMQTAHTILVLRGIFTSCLFYLSAGPVTQFFSIPESKWAFEFAALIPLIKGFLHLDPRRFQRRLQNGAHLCVEALPQFIVLIATVPVLLVFSNYQAVLWLALGQAIGAVLISHLVAERAYMIGWNPSFGWQLIRFGWPIWLSAFPLVAVYQGDRMFIGHLLGMEALAEFSVAFMITMVPGLLAAKVGHAIILPLLSQCKSDTRKFRYLYLQMTEAVVIATGAYLFAFLLAGEYLLPIAFGERYSGLGLVTAWLAVMWSMRMLQAVPGMAVMAQGETKPLLTAGIIRACGLILVFAAASQGYGLVGIAAAGCVAEFASFIYIARRAGQISDGMTSGFLHRCVFLVIATAMAITGHLIWPMADQSQIFMILVTILMTLVVSTMMLCALPVGRRLFSTLRVIS